MTTSFLTIDLKRYFNNDGISFDDNRSDGDFDCYGQTYPAEELPFSNEVFYYNSIKFLFPDKNDGVNNNISLDSQVINLSQCNYSNIHLLGSAEGGNFRDTFVIEYESKNEKKEIAFSDFFNDQPVFNEKKAIICSHFHTPGGDQNGEMNNIKPALWYNNIKLDSSKKVKDIILGDNPCIHIFSITMEIINGN